MKIKIVWIGKTKEPAYQALTDEYLKRLGRFCTVGGSAVKDEAAMLGAAELTGRSSARHTLVVLDARGKQFSSEEFASYLQNHMERNPAPLLFAVGSADGFSEEVRKSANLLLSLGKMTLAHELARVVLLEQLYRAFTILRGHPYHSGH